MAAVLQFKPSGNGHGSSDSGAHTQGDAEALDDLHYVLELWDGKGEALERCIGSLSDATVAYAAFCAAASAFPMGVLILRHKGRVLIQWNRGAAG